MSSSGMRCRCWCRAGGRSPRSRPSWGCSPHCCGAGGRSVAMSRLHFARLMVAALALSCSCALRAAADRAGCFTDDIRRITVPIDYNDPEGKTIQLAYRLRRGAEDRPAIIVLPGGPGATLIREDENATSGGIPENNTVVLTDPRGAGCNDDPALSKDSDFSSVWLARDTLAI